MRNDGYNAPTAHFWECLVNAQQAQSTIHLCVSVFSSLGGGHLHDFAWSPLDEDVLVLSESGALFGKGGGGTGIHSLELIVIVIVCVSHPLF